MVEASPQLEELFTACRSDAERAALAAYPGLAELLDRNQVLVPLAS